MQKAVDENCHRSSSILSNIHTDCNKLNTVSIAIISDKHGGVLPLKDIDEVPDQEDKLRRVRSYVPGFMGYGSEDNIRDAERLMRIQISQKIALARRELDVARESMLEEGLRAEVDEIDGVINILRRVDGEICHSDAGYCKSDGTQGLSHNDIDNLYEYDARLLEHMGTMLRLAGEIRSSAMAGDIPISLKLLDDLRGELSIFEEMFIRRMSVIGRR